MTTDPGSDGWYFDERTDGRIPGYVWTYGMEKWCNMEGQYIHIVADLRHLVGPYKMSICSVGVFGTCYIRDEKITDSHELTQGEMMTFSIPHYYSEYDIGTTYKINLRQKTLSQLSFISL